MKCPECDTNNLETHNYCRKCGIKLILACSKCDYDNQPGDKYCGKCGNSLENSSNLHPVKTAVPQAYTPKHLADKILTTRNTLEGERKNVTILFADVAESTAMFENLDPETVHEIMDSCFRILLDDIHRFEGTVNQFRGDGLMALFGAPIAHEDHAERACHAALAIQKSLISYREKLKDLHGIDFAMRIGVNSGPVVVAAIGDDLRMDYTAQGDTANLAARMEALAEPGTAFISENSFKLAKGSFRFENLGLQIVKGKSSPIQVYRVISARSKYTRFDKVTQKGFTAFTGREQELTALQLSLDKMIAGGGQLVTIAGEAGIGKSRLIYEFKNSIDPSKVRIFQGHCQSFWSNTNYFPFIGVLRRELSLYDQHEPEALENRTISEIRAISPELDKYLPFYLQLLSIPSLKLNLPEHLQGKEIKNAFQDAIASFFIRYSERHPILLILEDWQWSDEASESALNHMLSVINSLPIMVVTIYRPVYSSNWGNWSNHTPIILKQLDDLHIESIIQSVLDADSLHSGLIELLASRTGGNPLFIEEVCHSLRDNGTVKVDQDRHVILNHDLKKLTIPDKVQAIISARVDLLGSDEKEVLQIASVVGRSFTRRMIDKLYGNEATLSISLEKLKQLEMIQQTGILPETEFWFKHALTREVVYKSLLLRRRKELHGLVGQAIEQLYSNRIEEQINLLQYHFSLAENWPKAVGYGCKSAENAARLSQFYEAVAMYDKVLAWLHNLPENQNRLTSEMNIMLEQERLYETLGQRNQQQLLIDKLFSIINSDIDLSCQAEIQVRQGDLYTQLGRFDEAERFLNRSLTNWRNQANPEGESRSLKSLGFLRWHQKSYQAAIKCNENALKIDRKRGDLLAIATDLTNLAAVCRNLGDYSIALTHLKEALHIYENMNNPVREAFTLYSSANIHREQGTLDLAISQYRKAHKIFDKYNDRIMSSRAIVGIASIYREQGKYHESHNLYEKAVHLTRDTEYRQGLSHSLQALGDLLLYLNKPQKALEFLLESTKVFSELKDNKGEAKVWEKIGNIYAQYLDENRAAMSAWKRAKKLQMLIDDKSKAIETLEKMGQFAKQNLRDMNLALKYTKEAFSLSMSIGDRHKQGKLLNTIGIINWHLGSYNGALKSYEDALNIYLELEDTTHEGLMLNSIGKTYFKLGEFDRALSHLEEAINIHRKSGEKVLEGHALAVIGDIYRRMSNSDKALYYYQTSLNIRYENNDYKGQGWMFHSLSLVFLDQELFDKAREYLTKAQAVANKISDSELRQACAHICNQLSSKQ